LNLLKKIHKPLFILLLLALVARIISALIFPSYPIDIGCFKSWALSAAKDLPAFYSSGSFADYPPGYIYVLYIIGVLENFFRFDYNSNLFSLLVKLPSIITDIVITYYIYKTAEKFNLSKWSLILASIYAFNPAILLNSAIWGQIDSFYTLLLILFINKLTEDNLIEATIIFALGILVKPQIAIFAPLLIYAYFERKNLKTFVLGALSGAATIFLASLVFSIYQGNFIWIFNLYFKTFSSYPYATLNAYNIYALFGMNWGDILYKVAFITISDLGKVFIAIITIFSLFLLYKIKDKGKYFIVGLFLITSVFLLVPKMHERYMFPAIVLSLLVSIIFNDRRMLFAFFAISLTQFVNTFQVYLYALKDSYQVANNNIILIITSVINLLIFAYLVYYILKRFIFKRASGRGHSGDGGIINSKDYGNERNQISSISISEIVTDRIKKKFLDSKNSMENIFSPIIENKFKKLDYIFVILITLVYAGVSMVNLGSNLAPYNPWKSEKINSVITVDLGSFQDVSKISYFQGRDNGPFEISYENELGKSEKLSNVFAGYMFSWNSKTVKNKIRYISIKSEAENTSISELGIFDTKNELISPVIVSENGSALFDEQRTVPRTPSYFNSTYFDEIYFARTAYEFINHLQPYEWTHPPLGKILISFGIMIFGMNPFGWRIVGELFGILMIPAIYVFAKRIFSGSKYALFAAVLLSLDFMHFTQTRIATVDVYTVFFSLLMYYFMYMYSRSGFYKLGLKKSLIYLGLSGLFFGFGIATKWICVYGGLGLAVIYFASIYSRYKEYLYARNVLENHITLEKTETLVGIKRDFKPFTIKILAFSTLFFVVVPVIIYISSYYPFMLIANKVNSFSEIISYQFEMFKYHSQLVASHPFSSKWWEWPMMIKPIWYYSGSEYLAAGKASTISAFGNPIIWWLSVPAVVIAGIISFYKKDKSMFSVIVGYCALYLPWMLVPRLLFIYHYFGAAVFSIFSIVYVIKAVSGENKRKILVITENIIMGIIICVALLLFIMFYPVISGFVVDSSYVKTFLIWMKTWYFIS